MKLEAGCIYTTRSGNKVEIVREIRGEQGFRFLGIIDYGSYEEPATFTEDGRFLKTEKSFLDITKEWK
jgi:hypothetical protein